MKELLEQLAALAELRKKATPGPWTINNKFEQVWEPASGDFINTSDSPLDAAFIAAAGSLDFAALHAALAAVSPTLVGGAAAEPLAISSEIGWDMPKDDFANRFWKWVTEPGEAEMSVDDAITVRNVAGMDFSGWHDAAGLFDDDQAIIDYGDNMPAVLAAFDALLHHHNKALAALAPSPAAALAPGEAGGGWVSLADALPEVPKEQTRRLWVCIEGEVQELYFGNEVWMDENWDDEDPYTGWFLEGDDDGQPVYRGPAPTHFKYQEATPAAPTQERKEAHNG